MTIAERTAHPLRSDSIFFPAMAVAMALVVFAGFSPTYYLKAYFNAPPLTPLRIVHGAVFTAWMALLIVQTGFIAANKRDIHRRLGLLGTGLAVSMSGLGTALAISALRDGHAPSGAPSPIAFFAVPIFSIAAFALLVAAGIVKRARPDFHKRFMILATVAMLAAAIARIQIPFIANGGPPVFFGLTDIFIIVCAAYDLYIRQRIHPATLWGGGVILASQVLSLAVGGTDIWHDFSARLIG